jgi:hypothetical protein
MANSTCNPPSTTSAKYWAQEPTLVIVVWDDWGGWFDHVAPIAALQQNPHQGYTQCDPNSQWGCGYTSGFRVPMMVVSPYTGTYKNGTYSGYVSGACGASPLPACPNKVFPFKHDFGSILRFAELNFGMPYITNPDPYYADYNAPDNNHQGNVPLSDFFPLPVNQPRPFVSISTATQYTCFQHFGTCVGTTYVPTGPDDDNEADQ